MKPIQGPTDYHRYPPRARRQRREAERRAAQESVRHAKSPIEESAGGSGFAPEESQAPRTSRRRTRHASRHFAQDMHATHEPQHHILRRKTSRNSKRNRAAHDAPPIARRPLWKRLRKIALLLLVIALAQGAAALLSSSRFAVKNVRIEGDAVVPVETANEVRAALIGQNWVRARWGNAQQQLQRVPEVRRAQIARVWSWPPQLKVSIAAREPFARVGAGVNWFVVDQSGTVFRRAQKRDENLYAVTGDEFKPEIGCTFAAKQWQSVVEFARLLTQDEAGGWNLRRVYFDKSGFASLRLRGGASDETLVQLGDSDWPQKLRTARWALAEFARTGKHAATLNLLSSNVTTWTPRAENATANASLTSDGPTRNAVRNAVRNG